MRQRTIEIVVTQHLEEVAILWLRRDDGAGQPHYFLKDLAEFDDQLAAHLDGLKIAGESGWVLCEQELRWQEPGEVFAAALLAFADGDGHRIQTVLDVVDQSTEPSRALVSALGWLPYDRAAEHINQFLSTETPWLRRIGIAAAAAHRHDPGAALAAAIKDSDSLLRARALRAVGELGRVDLLNAAGQHVGAEDDLCRFSAAWSVALLSGAEEAIEELQAVVERSGSGSERALQLALRRMEIGQGESWIQRLAELPHLARPAVVGAGVLGVPESISWLIDQMQIPELARVAGEAFTAITGLALDSQPFEGEWPEGFVAGPTEDPEDENVEMDADENLPWPNREAIADWWRKHRDRFEPGTRYLVGRPMTVEWLDEVLRNGYQRQRAAAALELAIRQPGTPLFEVRAPGWRQQKLLAAGGR
ncbi:MAG: TIGR02270 family protein [Planctomycetes bacterium]|nr:TIGR02270 family protein [Planctomycetota bacterium]